MQGLAQDPEENKGYNYSFTQTHKASLWYKTVCCDSRIASHLESEVSNGWSGIRNGFEDVVHSVIDGLFSRS